MTEKEILQMTDHTLLSSIATWEDIRKICDEGLEYETASVCIPPSYVQRAKWHLKGELPICTVIGFPNGYHTLQAKLFETGEAILMGASEIDVVINLGDVKGKLYDKVAKELYEIRQLCEGVVLKVIVETPLLTEEEKIILSDVVTSSGADFIKTCTGFAGGGATVEDVKLFSYHIGRGVEIKASGGISSFNDARKLIEAGATRLGTSRLISCLKSEKPKENY